MSLLIKDARIVNADWMSDQLQDFRNAFGFEFELVHFRIIKT